MKVSVLSVKLFMSQCKSFATLNVHVALLYHELVLLDAVQDVRVVGRVRDQMPHILRWSCGVRGSRGVRGVCKGREMVEMGIAGGEMGRGGRE